MGKKSETRIQERIRDRLKAEFPTSFFFKVWGGPFQMAGIPDLVGCVEGMFCSFEIKTNKGEPSKIQEAVINLIRRAGGIAEIVRTPEEAIDAVYQHAEKIAKRLRILSIGRLPARRR